MKKIFALLLGISAVVPAYGDVWQAKYGVAETFNFKLYNADGTLDVDESDGGTEVSLSCNEGAETTATNDFADEGTFYSIALTAAELQCERVAVVIAATTTEVFFIQTNSHASAMSPNVDANVTQFGGTNGTFASGRAEANTTHIAGSAVSTSSAQIGVNIINAAGTAWGSGAITAGAIATDAIGAAEVADGAIDAGALAADAITAAKIASDVSTEINANVLTALGVQTGTITISSQTSFTLSAGSADNDAYNDWAILVIDQSTAAQRALGIVNDYTGASKTVTLREDPGIFTMATGDLFVLMPAKIAAAFDVNVISVEGTDSTDYYDGLTTGLSTFDASTEPVELSTDGVNAIRDLVVEDQGSITLGCVLAVLAAYAAGDVSTTGDDSVFEDASGAETRIEGTAATPGNRGGTITCPSY
jgi:hypothetical protein